MSKISCWIRENLKGGQMHDPNIGWRDRRSSRELLAAEALRLTDGSLPAGVEQLLARQIEDKLIDPFTLNTFQLRVAGNWLMIESPGPTSDWSREPWPLQLRLPLVR